MNKIIWLDCETTGLDKDKNGIITLAIMIEIDGEIKEERTFKMNPKGRTLEDTALEINGFTHEQVESFDDWKKVKNEFTSCLAKYISKYDKYDKLSPAGYNIITFDLGFIESWFKECGDNYLYSWLNRTPLDVYRVVPFMEYAELFHVTDNRKLGTVAAALGIELENAHEAMADVKATKAILTKFQELVKK